MNPLYRVTLRVRSGLGTPLAADTLWGHIAWGIRWWEGEPALTQWLERHETSDPPLVVSDPLPAGYWPRPAVPPPPRPDHAPTLEAAARFKSLAKIAWIADGDWAQIAQSLGPQSLADILVPGGRPSVPASVTEGQVHAGVNRLTGGTTGEEGGTLFSADRTFYRDPPTFHVYAQSPDPAETVLRWFRQGLDGGYGRDAATGAGQIEVVGAEPWELPRVQGADAAVALAAFCPEPTDPTRGFFKPGVRCGRLGGDFATGPTPDGQTLRQKRPVSVFLTGTLLHCPADRWPQGPPATVGRVVSGVHPYAPIRQYAAALLLPCRLDLQLAQHPLLWPKQITANTPPQEAA